MMCRRSTITNATTNMPTPSLWVLVPFWFVTIGSVVLSLVAVPNKFDLYGYWNTYPLDRPGATYDGHYNDYNFYQNLASAYLAWAVVIILASIITLAPVLLSAIFFLRHSLYPTFIIISNASVMVMWMVLLICSFVAPPQQVDLFQLLGEALLILASMSQLVYGVVLFKRMRRVATGPRKMLDDEDEFRMEAVEPPQYDAAIGEEKPVAGEKQAVEVHYK